MKATYVFKTAEPIKTVSVHANDLDEARETAKQMLALISSEKRELKLFRIHRPDHVRPV